ncbi:MAG: hypothetical protein SFW67_22435 [Myxococcaceae bacterium]|nr:hypothetical protein [Myxococcaceae bacterium]
MQRLRRLSLSFLVLSACVEPALPPPEAPAVTVMDGGVACSPRTCTGCCVDNRCVGGNQDEACGYDGRSCQRCGAGLRCEAPGACYPKPRAADAGTAPPPASTDAGIPIDRQVQAGRCIFFSGVLFCN